MKYDFFSIDLNFLKNDKISAASYHSALVMIIHRILLQSDSVMLITLWNENESTDRHMIATYNFP
jgi:hypothetical protein